MVKELGGGGQWERNPLLDPNTVLLPPSQSLRGRSDFTLNSLRSAGSDRPSVLSECLLDEDMLCEDHSLGPPAGHNPELQVPLTLAVSACVTGGTVAVAGAEVEMSVVPAAHATWVPGDLWSDKKETLRGGLSPAGQAGASLSAEGQGFWDSPSGCCQPPPGSPDQAAPARGRQGGALTTQPPCVVPGFEAARDASCAERTPGALLVGDDGLPVDLPVASVRASSRGWKGPALGLAACPTSPFSSFWPSQEAGSWVRQGDFLGKKR